MSDYLSDSDFPSPVVLDLFCGAGGMSLGFQRAGYTVGLGVDNDPLACQTHAHNFGQQHTACADITTITDPMAFIHEHGLARVEVIIGGPPCQGFSRVGRGKLRRYKVPNLLCFDQQRRIHRQGPPDGS